LKPTNVVIDASCFEETHILVTGGAGFIGSHIVDFLMRNGASVRVLDDLSNGDMSNIAQWVNKREFELIVGDIRNRNDVAKSLRDVSLVFHQASKVSVPFSIDNPHLVTDVNVMGTTVVLDECRKADVDRVVVASSSSVYGDTTTLPKTEDMHTNPMSPYAASKLAEESIALVFSATYDMNISALRYFNVYGPRQRGGSYAGVMAIFISQALRYRPLFIDGDGQQTRDFTYIDDIVECNLLAAQSSQSKGNVYNVGGGAQTTIESLADRIIKETESKSTKTFREPRLGDVRDSLASIEKAKKDLGYIPKTDINAGLKLTIQWVRDTGVIAGKCRKRASSKHPH